MSAMNTAALDTDEPSELPKALRTGFSIGQGLAAIVMIVGAVLLMNAATAAESTWGVALLVIGIAGLAAVETVRVTRRRRAERDLLASSVEL